MGIHTLLERMGFVRLRDFGLILTSDRRIVTTRPVLDDGFGSTVVGWEGNDLAMMELPRAPAAAAVVSLAAPKSIPSLPAATSSMPTPIVAAPIMATPPMPTPIVRAPIVAPPLALALAPTALAPIAPAPSPPPVITQAVTMAKPVLAAAPPTEEKELTEDEWEWEIAAARARAVETVVPALPVRAKTIPKQAREMSVVKPTPNTTSRWLTTEPLKNQWQDDTAIRSVTRLARASEQQLGSNVPRTIIPVPTLPAAVDARLVVDEITRQLPMPRHRAARGTNPAPQVGNDDTSTAVDVRAVSAQRR